MDIYCPVCGEPFDFDELHEEARARWEGGDYSRVYEEVLHQFQRKGCEALGDEHTTPALHHFGPDAVEYYEGVFSK